MTVGGNDGGVSWKVTDGGFASYRSAINRKSRSTTASRIGCNSELHFEYCREYNERKAARPRGPRLYPNLPFAAKVPAAAGERCLSAIAVVAIS